MKIRNEFQIGLVGLITLIILFVGIKFLKGTEIFSTNRSYYAIYKNVGGMHEGSYIYINGLKTGYVKQIKPIDNINSSFLVEISMDKKIKIPKDSQLTMFSDGLLGGKALRIDIGTSNAILLPNDTIIGYIESSMMDGLSNKIDPMITDLSSVIKRIDTLTNSLNNALNTQSQQNIQQILFNINSASKKLDNLVMNADNLISKDKQKLDNMITNMESVTQNLMTITDSIDSAKISSTLNNVNSSFYTLNTMLQKIENGEGNLGLLLNDKNLYNNLTESTKNLNILIEDIKKNPKKYINVKVF